MNNTDKILLRLYDKLGVLKDSEFCKKYNLKASTVSSWRKRDSIPYDLIIEISQNANFSLDYVLKGVIKEHEVNYKEEIIKSLDKLKNEDIKSVYHFIKSKEI